MQRQGPAELPDHAGTLADYDWTRFGRHRLRVPAGNLIDAPLARSAQMWLGTMWPDNYSIGGWARMLWEPDLAHGRGWMVPARLSGGDVIEFGANQAGNLARWYGIIDSYDAVEWLTLQGPYTDPAAAFQDGERRLAEIRFQPAPNQRAHRPCTRSAAMNSR